MTQAIEHIALQQRGLLSRLCRAAGLSRASFYRLRAREAVGRTPGAAETELRSRIQQIALRWPAYGYRRITAELNRSGCKVNHKRVLKLSTHRWWVDGRTTCCACGVNVLCPRRTLLTVGPCTRT